MGGLFGMEWQTLAADFRKFHKHPLNVALHLVTTPAAVYAISFLVFTYLGSPAAMGMHAAWLAIILPSTPLKLWLASAAAHALICAAAIATTMTTLSATVLFAASYFAQDVAHFATCELTFQSSYQGKQDGWMWTLLEHTLHLVPLCFDACWHTENGSLATIFVQRQQVATHKLSAANGPEEKELLQAVEHVGNWAVQQNPRTDVTTHWWWHGLSAEATEKFAFVARSQYLRDALFGKLYPSQTHVVEPLEGMNELYVACKTYNANSDTVFYRNHVDGPYGIFPFVHVYRSMIAATPNEQIETIFPLSGRQVRHNTDKGFTLGGYDGVALTTGEMISFDFHRELHRIAHVQGAKENEGHRVCLKVHFLIYPRFLGPLGRLLGRMSVHYNQNFRSLFLATLEPDHPIAKFMAFQVVFWTAAMYRLEMHLGWTNLIYLLCATAVSLAARSYSVFFCLTSFVHYAVYASTYHQRTNVAFGAFKRDALLFKTLALVQAGVQFLFRFDYSQPDIIALALLAGGFGLAGLAASRLGVDRTYFGWELGVISGDYVAKFPYGVIPHPMILGGVIGWLGFHKLDGFREAFPAYVPVHIALYLCHALQEHFAIHSNGKLAASGSAVEGKKVK
ncbi:hypothetical protein Ctob_002074 [Chrysochromulina tobinii]|uniref:phosphatidyl-N-methylethanolamine N-methyltransferase n=1 Tax=Chrysochromulina tobinii TaxID=1460289 RepID=A0A0M0J4K7_9EUKA|nr:hypothetical protein Ctob_002074 [Chrysochromulina tobinii]|eukprot:KOO21501.1 hypothetical protein Ctob_002074 [Chrysochromulina sp. CCMP291]